MENQETNISKKPLSEGVLGGSQRNALISYEEFVQDKDPKFLFVSTLWLTGDGAVAVR